MSEGARILLFARAPVPGQVKTRLAGALGPRGAASLYRVVARHCLLNACEAMPGGVDLWCTPDTTHPFFQDCAQELDVVLFTQGGGDLGTRMSDALRRTLERASAALVMGTDVPSITCADIRAAVCALDSGMDAVVCPTEDGGYGLLGLRRHDARVFQGIEWGADTVMERTRTRFAGLGWRWTELPVRWDIDLPCDLARLATIPGLERVTGGLPK